MSIRRSGLAALDAVLDHRPPDFVTLQMMFLGDAPDGPPIGNVGTQGRFVAQYAALLAANTLVPLVESHNQPYSEHRSGEPVPPLLEGH